MQRRVSTACLLAIGGEFEARFAALGKPQKLPNDLDDRALACLCVCAEREDAPEALDVAVLLRCIKALEGLEMPFWFNKLPFTLALSLLGATTESPSQVLRSQVTHGSAAVREYVLMMGWTMRKHLKVDVLAPPLLLNVENTLGCWIESLALCRSLYATEADFWRAIEDYKPIDMADQFADRIQDIRKKPYLIEAPIVLLNCEARIQKLVIRQMLRLDTQPIGGSS